MSLVPRLRLQLAKVAILEPGRADTLAEQELLPAVESATLLLHRTVQQKTPVGATGIARGSISSALETVRGRTTTTFRGRVFSAQPYVVGPLEQGTRPHWVPIAPLKRWSRIKLGDERLAYAVQVAISRRGTKGAHMFRDGHADTKGKIERILRAAVTRWQQRLKGS